MRGRPLVIEFMGLPGAGKTTLAQLVREDLTAAGYCCFSLSRLDAPEEIEKRKGGLVSKLRTLSGLVTSSLRYGSIARAAFLYTLHVRPLNLASLRRFIVLLTRLDFMRGLVHSRYQIVLLDQGLLQNVWSLSATGEPPADDRYLMRLLEAIHAGFSPLVVGVHVGADLATERVTTRPTMRSRFDTLPPARAQSLLARHEDVISKILRLSAELHGDGCLDVNGGRPPEQNVRLIVPFIQSARPHLQPLPETS